jgi:DNA polymerase-4
MLHELHIATIGQLADADPILLERELGTWGPILHSLANGEDLRTVECDRGRKSYGEENTFTEDAVDADLIEATIIAHAETVARRMRRDDVQGRTITLKYRPSGPQAEFRLVTRSHTVEQPTDDGAVIANAAIDLWHAEPTVAAPIDRSAGHRPRRRASGSARIVRRTGRAAPRCAQPSARRHHLAFRSRGGEARGT